MALRLFSRVPSEFVSVCNFLCEERNMKTSHMIMNFSHEQLSIAEIEMCDE